MGHYLADTLTKNMRKQNTEERGAASDQDSLAQNVSFSSIYVLKKIFFVQERGDLDKCLTVFCKAEKDLGFVHGFHFCCSAIK